MMPLPFNAQVITEFFACLQKLICHLDFIQDYRLRLCVLTATDSQIGIIITLSGIVAHFTG